MKIGQEVVIVTYLGWRIFGWTIKSISPTGSRIRLENPKGLVRTFDQRGLEVGVPDPKYRRDFFHTNVEEARAQEDEKNRVREAYKAIREIGDLPRVNLHKVDLAERVRVLEELLAVAKSKVEAI